MRSLIPVSAEILLHHPHLVGHGLRTGADDDELLAGIDGLDRRRQRNLTEGNAAGQGVTDRGASARRRQDARDIDAVLLEKTFVHGDGIWHAVELPAPMGHGDGLGSRGRCAPGRDGSGEAYDKANPCERFPSCHDVFPSRLIRLCISSIGVEPQNWNRCYSRWLSARPWRFSKACTAGKPIKLFMSANGNIGAPLPVPIPAVLRLP